MSESDGSQRVAGLVEAVSRHAESAPDALAVAYPAEGTALTYRELDGRAARLAGHLASRGVRPGDHVVLCLPPGAELVVAFLAVVRAGAAYVPLDPGHPAERRRLIARDCAARAVVTLSRFADAHADTGPTVIALDADAERITERDSTFAPVPVGPEATAYVCYTSGTTGAPKGVVVPHRAVLDLVNSTDYVRIAADDNVAQAANPAFDAITFEIWATLWAGATVVGLEKDVVLDPIAFESAVRDHGVTVLFLTTALFQQIANERPAAFAPLRTLLFGGEVCDPRTVRRVLEASPPARLLNVYGPTEATTFATWHEIGEHDDFTRPIPIGTGIGATVTRVLDGHGAPVGPGGTGELYLGGPCLALGYLGQDGLTGERFVPDPTASAEAPGRGGGDRRLYRTGDRVTVREDGALVFQDRVDHQVKLRGFRIEPGEIEVVLVGHPSVAQATVIPRRTPSGDKSLAAYVVPSTSGTADGDALTAEWHEIYETLYSEPDTAGFGENFVGWNSSYDHAPLPRHEMREWRDATVARIRELDTRRVLEIGVGTGLLLAHLAPGADEYWATDFSGTVLDALRLQLRERPELRDKVTLRCQAADVTAGLPRGHFTTVVLNSVVQYFPDAGYLRAVIEGVLPLLAPGGCVFLGDLRNAALQRHLQTGVALAPGDPAREAEAVRREIHERVTVETELLLDPGFFDVLARDLPGIRSTDVRVKRGHCHNELTRYRFDAVLGTAPPAADLREAPRAAWGEDIADAEDLARHLKEHRPARLRVTGVPDARTAGERAATAALDGDAGVAAALAALASPPAAGAGGAGDPEELCALAERMGYRALATWSGARDAGVRDAGAGDSDAPGADGSPDGSGDGALDVVLLDPRHLPPGRLTSVFVTPEDDPRALSDCANTPTAFDRTVDPALVLRRYLRERLPDYMVPATITTLGAMPLTTNGKVDRKALPEPVRGESAPGLPPATPLEEALCDLFADTLGMPRRDLHADSDFFLSGGHSLAGARLLSRLRTTLGVDPGGRALYEAPTPAALAALLGEETARSHRPDGVPGRETSASASPRPDTDTCRLLPLRLTGPLDTEALRTALRDVARRHAMLRTTFTATGRGGGGERTTGAPDAVRADLPVLRTPSGTGVAEVLRAAAHPLPDPYGTTPAWRAELHQVGPDDHLLLVLLHPWLADVWSLAPLGADLLEAYRSRVNEHAPRWEPLPPLGPEPRDRGTAPDAVRPTPLPTTTATATATGRRPDDGVPGHGVHRARLRADLHARLTAYAAEHDTTLSALLHAALAALLTRQGAAGPIVTTAPVARPGGPATRRTVAPLTTACALRVDTSGDPAFGVLVRRTHEAVVQACLRPGAEPALPGGVALALWRPALPSAEVAGVEAAAEPAPAPYDGADLSLVLTEEQSHTGACEGIAVTAFFRGEVLAGESAAGLVDAWITLLDSAMADPERRVGRLDLIAPAALERAQRQWNGDEQPLEPGTVARLLEATIRETSDAPALERADGAGPAGPVITYAELARRAENATGAAPTGRAAAPAGPASPFASPVGQVAALAAAARAGGDRGLVLHGEAGAVAGGCRIGARRVDAAAAYRRQTLPGARAAWLAEGTYGGTAGAVDLLAALAAGNTVLVPRPGALGDPPALAAWLAESGAQDAMAGQETALRLCQAIAASDRRPEALRSLTVTGDAYDPDPALLRAARDLGLRLVHRGGPEEARLVRVHGADGGVTVAPNHQVYVLDAALRPVAPGGTGALCVAGAGVASGYPGLPGDTAERFLPDPYRRPGARMWRAGRAARRCADGRVEVLAEPWPEDPYEDEYGTFRVVESGTGRHAVWPSGLSVPAGWREVHAEDLRELCREYVVEHAAGGS
ncbi:amino acid adenylation domain-containing protein [Streptomyces sp. NPDC096310]|uniref:amino acid adenylation domain-containing protein n=1 Tax=Streptomyces sp. NPDC096310 TaxID=3366082 RepID=UPI0037F8AD42